MRQLTMPCLGWPLLIFLSLISRAADVLGLVDNRSASASSRLPCSALTISCRQGRLQPDPTGRSIHAEVLACSGKANRTVGHCQWLQSNDLVRAAGAEVELCLHACSICRARACEVSALRQQGVLQEGLPCPGMALSGAADRSEAAKARQGPACPITGAVQTLSHPFALKSTKSCAQ